MPDPIHDSEFEDWKRKNNTPEFIRFAAYVRGDVRLVPLIRAEGISWGLNQTGFKIASSFEQEIIREHAERAGHKPPT